jgi:predicted TIM-barrel fold metal-dependent hydrolase
MRAFSPIPGNVPVQKNKILSFRLFTGRRLKYLIIVLFLFLPSLPNTSHGQVRFRNAPLPGFEKRITDYIYNLRVSDSHEHLIDPVILKQSNLLDFTLILHQFSYNDFISSGLPAELTEKLWSNDTPPAEKWKIIRSYWDGSFNTTFNRMALLAVSRLYGIEDINESTVGLLSKKIRDNYQTDWFHRILKDSCRIDQIVQDGEYHVNNFDRIYYVKRFTGWLTVRSKFRIDSISIVQNVYPIVTLNDFVLSMEKELNEAVKKGIVGIKINIAYHRTLNIENPTADAARKIFQTLIKSEESYKMPQKDAKPLQDYLFHQLMLMASVRKLPVVIHTGMQSGNGINNIDNSDPALLTAIITRYPDIDFALFHGSYPYGGKLATLAKNFKNVYIDLSWIYAISPSYSERYLNEWLETVPVNKIMAFGGDMRCVENVYSELLIAKSIIGKVLIARVKDGYFSEEEAMTVARMILHDNVVNFYNLH